MKILVPEMAYLPLGSGVAVVDTCARSEPQCGSVRHIVPDHSPDTRRGRYFACSASLPCASSVLMAPFDKPGYMVHVQFAVAVSSLWMSDSDTGMPCPPHFSGKDRPC